MANDTLDVNDALQLDPQSDPDIKDLVKDFLDELAALPMPYKDNWQRPKEVWATDIHGNEFLSIKNIYGEEMPASKRVNHLGKIYKTYDGGDVQLIMLMIGNLLRAGKRLTSKYGENEEWHKAIVSNLFQENVADQQLSAEEFFAESKFDTLLEKYSSITRIPFNLKIGNYISLPETIYARNFDGQNLLEFRFDKVNKTLYEISLVTLQNSSLVDKSLSDISVDKTFYLCILDEKNSNLSNAFTIRIFRDKNSICLNWGSENLNNLSFFTLARNCFSGVDRNSNLVAVILTGLSEQDVVKILGI